MSVCEIFHAKTKAINLSPSNNIVEKNYIQNKLDCGNGWIHADELGCILFNSDSSKMNLTWVQAQTECELIDGFLVEIYGEKEQKFLRTQIDFLETLVGRHSYWIGATDFGKDGDWMWITSRNPVNYSSWEDGRPNDIPHNSDDCVLLDCSKDDSKCNWRDFNCNEGTISQYSTSFICQKYNDTIKSTTETITTTEFKTTTTPSRGYSCNDFTEGGDPYSHYDDYCFVSQIDTQEFCIGQSAAGGTKIECTNIDGGIRFEFDVPNHCPMRFNQAGEIICQNYHPDYLQNLAKALGYGHFRLNVTQTGNGCTLAWLDASGNLQTTWGNDELELPYDVSFYG